MAVYSNNVLPHEYRCPHTGAELRPIWCVDCKNADTAYALYAEFKRAYYNGSPLVEDEQFDNYELNCRRAWPDDTRFEKVGG